MTISKSLEAKERISKKSLQKSSWKKDMEESLLLPCIEDKQEKQKEWENFVDPNSRGDYILCNFPKKEIQFVIEVQFL